MLKIIVNSIIVSMNPWLVLLATGRSESCCWFWFEQAVLFNVRSSCSDNFVDQPSLNFHSIRCFYQARKFDRQTFDTFLDLSQDISHVINTTHSFKTMLSLRRLSFGKSRYLSLDLFYLYNRLILRKLKVQPRFIIGKHNLNTIIYANDTMLMVDTERKLQELLNKVLKESRKK